MFNRLVSIPKAFHELHGEKARISHLLLVYFAGAVSAAVFIYGLWSYDLSWWKYLVAGIIMLDIGGGVVANLSTPTNRYYYGRPAFYEET
jgi:predicted permease